MVGSLNLAPTKRCCFARRVRSPISLRVKRWPPSGDTAAILTCEAHERRRDCELDLVEVSTGQRRGVQAPVEGTWTSVTGPVVPTDTPPWNATAPDGRILAGLGVREGLEPKPSESYLVAIDPADDSVTELRSFDGPLHPAAWDQRGKYVVLADSSQLIVVESRRRAHHYVARSRPLRSTCCHPN